MKKVKRIFSGWTPAEKAIAQDQLKTYGVIILDYYGSPIDDPLLLEQLHD